MIQPPPINGVPREIEIDLVEPNPWNPNEMDRDMFLKELRSIQRYGFVDPVTVRSIGKDRWQIIDGENRWRAAKQLGFRVIPCTDLGVVVDDDAKSLTIILNETRGSPNKARLQVVLRELVDHQGEAPTVEIMPFTPERFQAIVTDAKSVDYDGLKSIRKDGPTRRTAVERVYRLQRDVAELLDEALAQAKVDGADSDEEAIRLICEMYLGDRTTPTF